MYEFLDYETRDVMTRDPVTIGPERSLADAEGLFEEHGFNGLPVVAQDGELRGIVTKLDLLRAFEFTEAHMFPPYAEIMKQPVSAIMSEEPHSVRPKTRLTRVLHQMVEMGNKSFPVVDGHRLVGMVAREDVVRALRSAASGQKAGSGASS
jgi:CBS domain-containing protein